MINPASRLKRCLCAAGVFLFFYSMAGVLVSHYFLDYYAQQLITNANLNLDLQPCPSLCGYSYIRQKSKNYCCDFYGCKYKSQCQEQKKRQYSIQLIIYKVIFGISIAYMSIYIIYQIFKLLIFRLAPYLRNCINGGQNQDGFEISSGSQNILDNSFKSESEETAATATKTRLLEDYEKPSDQKTDCSICLQNFERQDAQQLKCGHKFHKQCIAVWASLKKTCPLCRRGVSSNRRFL